MTRELEEERDFLLRSLDDLDREYAAGDVDEVDYRTLRDGYTARAAQVLRALGGGSGSSGSGSAGSRSAGRRVGVIAGVVLVAVLAGVLVAQSSGRRGGGGLTGLDVSAVSSRLDDCQAMDSGGDPDGALSCYGAVLEELPASVEALTFRGWLQVREFDVEDGIADLDAAIQLAPRSTAPYVFRASGRARSGDPIGAVADLAAFEANDPTPEEQGLAEGFAATIVDDALDACIAGDVSGELAVGVVVECYGDVLGVDEGNPVASAYLGWLVARSGADDERAMTLLDRAVAGIGAGDDAGDGTPAALVFRAALRGHLGDVDGARDDLARFAELDAPDDQVAAAAQVSAALDAGQDPLP